MAFLSLTGQFVAAQVIINEYQSKNQRDLEDEDGDTPDWIELFNTSAEQLDLSGYVLSDDTLQGKWNLPIGTILEANEYLVIFASGKNRAFPNLHTSFSLSSEGEPVVLFAPDGQIADQLVAQPLEVHRSFGRLVDGEQETAVLYEATPGTSNSTSRPIHLFDVLRPAGFYAEPVSVDLVINDVLGQVHYSTDGSEPTLEHPVWEQAILLESLEGKENRLSMIPTTPLEGPDHLESFVYKAPKREVDKCHILRWRSFLDGKANSEVESATYFVGEGWEDKHDLPIISLITNEEELFDYEQGMYVPGKDFENTEWTGYHPPGNYNRETELGANFEFFDTGNYFSEYGGLEMFGFAGRTMPQKSMRFVARKGYGNKRLEHCFFPDRNYCSFKSLILRNAGNDFIKTHIRDVVQQELVASMDVDVQANRSACLYLNGEYWGIVNLKEQFDESFFENNYQLESGSYDLIKNGFEVVKGDTVKYNQFLEFLELADLSLPENYQVVNDEVDIDRFIEYQIAQIFIGNFDWPGNNIKYFCSKDAQTKWNWLIYDLDMGFGFLRDSERAIDHNTLASATEVDGPSWPNPPWSTILFRKLLENQQFRDKYIDRFSFHLENTFSLENMLAKIDLFESLYSNEMRNHIDRWNYPSSYSKWEKEVDLMREFAVGRPCRAVKHLMLYFDLEVYPYDCADFEQEQNAIAVIHNPINNEIDFIYNSQEETDIELRLIDLNGKALQKGFKESFEGANRYSWSTSDVPTGQYILQIFSANQMDAVQVFIP